MSNICGGNIDELITVNKIQPRLYYLMFYKVDFVDFWQYILILSLISAERFRPVWTAKRLGKLWNDM